MKKRPCLLLVFACACSKGNAATSTEATSAPLALETREVKELPMPHTLQLVGTLRGRRQAELAANATGKVVETFVERGSAVKEGTVLARLDVRAAAIAAAEAKANARGAASQASASRADCERSRVLLQKGALSQQDFDRLSAQCQSSSEALEAAEARAALSAKNVGDGIIRAPFTGMVTERYVNVGEYVREDTKVVKLATVDPVRLELTVGESRFADLKVGQPVSFSVRAYPERRFPAQIVNAGGAIRETTRDVVIEAEAPNADLALRPGMFASAEVILDERPTPAVPKTAIVGKAGETHVFVVVQGRAEERVIDRGAEKEGDVAVLRGVRSGERVVVAPPSDLKNGQAVK